MALELAPASFWSSRADGHRRMELAPLGSGLLGGCCHVMLGGLCCITKFYLISSVSEHGAGLQVLAMKSGRSMNLTLTIFLEFNSKNGGQRMATLLMYLSDVEERGQNIFPDANVNNSPYHGTVNFQSVPEEVLLSNQRWEMHY